MRPAARPRLGRGSGWRRLFPGVWRAADLSDSGLGTSRSTLPAVDLSGDPKVNAVVPAHSFRLTATYQNWFSDVYR